MFCCVRKPGTEHLYRSELNKFNKGKLISSGQQLSSMVAEEEENKLIFSSSVYQQVGYGSRTEFKISSQLYMQL